ncbi:MAG: DUF485 domain-containing protein [Cytophagaceae bacterium]
MKNDTAVKPDLKSLIRTRWIFSIIFSSIILLVYFGYISTIAFNKTVLREKVGSLPIGLHIGLGIIVFSWILTGVYVYWANSRYDRKVENVKNQINKK